MLSYPRPIRNSSPPGALPMTTAPLLAGLALLAAAPEPSTANPRGDNIPGPTSSDPKNGPTLNAYLPANARATGTAVVVCPGGGYSGRATGHEGQEIADWLTARGVAALVLKYRTVNESKISPPLQPGPMLDVQRAIRTVRAH